MLTMLAIELSLVRVKKNPRGVLDRRLKVCEKESELYTVSPWQSALCNLLIGHATALRRQRIVFHFNSDSEAAREKYFCRHKLISGHTYQILNIYIKNN